MTNSKHPDFDWHAKGIWMIVDRLGQEWHPTINGTPHGCRATFLRMENRPWSRLVADGYYVQKFVPAA
ncbi:hypothetical protein [Herminiimonas sp. CN]|uniref:hypothetical protein n=1 Tax=Herminiimonas sp. CN TaxID=1349818 RepID=UPI000474327C|nr:hypothetical protein [Herminiimonas sp. CN]